MVSVKHSLLFLAFCYIYLAALLVWALYKLDYRVNVSPPVVYCDHSTEGLPERPRIYLITRPNA